MEDILNRMRQSGAFLEGHFLLSSGKHSGGYCQCAKLLRFPEQAEATVKAALSKMPDLGITKVCGPAMGGVIVSYETARQLGVESIFTERENGEMRLRRGFGVGDGDRILIAEDVVTTGVSTLETVRVLEAFGAKALGVLCIVDRRREGHEFGLPIYSALRLNIETYEPENCPLCRANIPLEKPGSREMRK